MKVLSFFKNCWANWWSEFLIYRPIFWLVLISTAANLSVWVLYVVRLKVAHQPYYSPIIRDFSAKADQSYLLPIFCLIVLIVNLYLAKKVFTTNRLLTYLLLGSILLVHFLVMIIFFYYLKLI